MIGQLLLVIAVTTAVSYSGTKGYIAALRGRHYLNDNPNSRSSHIGSIVTGGGIVFGGITLLSWVFISYFFQASLIHLTCSLFLIMLVSLWDDLRGLGVTVRLTMHILAAFLFVSSLSEPQVLEKLYGQYEVIFFIFSILFIAAVTNLFNFLDGLDGLAGSNALIVTFYLICSSIYYHAEALGDLYALGILFGAVLGFLLLNWHPAKVFMGDTGSTFLGFLISAWIIRDIHVSNGFVRFYCGLIFLSPCILDCGLRTLLRMYEGKPWTQPHRSFFFQQYALLCASPRTISLYYAGLLGIIGIILVGACFTVRETTYDWYVVPAFAAVPFGFLAGLIGGKIVLLAKRTDLTLKESARLVISSWPIVKSLQCGFLKVSRLLPSRTIYRSSEKETLSRSWSAKQDSAR